MWLSVYWVSECESRGSYCWFQQFGCFTTHIFVINGWLHIFIILHEWVGQRLSQTFREIKIIIRCTGIAFFVMYFFLEKQERLTSFLSSFNWKFHRRNLSYYLFHINSIIPKFFTMFHLKLKNVLFIDLVLQIYWRMIIILIFEDFTYIVIYKKYKLMINSKLVRTSMYFVIYYII